MTTFKAVAALMIILLCASTAMAVSFRKSTDIPNEPCEEDDECISVSLDIAAVIIDGESPRCWFSYAMNSGLPTDTWTFNSIGIQFDHHGRVMASHDSISQNGITYVDSQISDVLYNSEGLGQSWSEIRTFVQSGRRYSISISSVSYNCYGQVETFDASVIQLSSTPAYVLTTAESDCLFNWGEDNYPSLLSPSRPTSQSSSPYYFRYYTGSNTYLGCITK